MKIKFNIPTINKIKDKYINVIYKIKENKTALNKVPMRFYGLLGLMLLLGIVTISNNIRVYQKASKENYVEYELEDYKDNVGEVSNNKTVYIIDESSIYTDIPNVDQIAKTSSTVQQRYMMPIYGEIIKEYAVDKLVYSNTLDMWKIHPGIDIKANIGEDVKAVCDGSVIDILTDSFYGHTIKLLSNEGYTFVYSNLDEVTNLKIGDIVKKKDVIGKIGVSAKGEILDDSHLHFEILVDQKQINPLDLLQVEE